MTRLPNRRDGVIVVFPWGNFDVHLHYGFNEDREIMEVFGNIFIGGCFRELDGDLGTIIRDICRSISLELQDGTPASVIAYRMIRDDENRALSLFGAVADAICAEQYQ